MKKIILIIALSISCFSCKNDKIESEMSLETKELQQKDKELESSEKEFPAENSNTARSDRDQQAADLETENQLTITENTADSENRKLRFLYYSNAGLRAYFDDGSIVLFPKLDLTKANIQFIKSNRDEKSIQTYVIKEDGSLLLDGWKHEYPVVNKAENYEGWAMVNYKWYMKY